MIKETHTRSPLIEILIFLCLNQTSIKAEQMEANYIQNNTNAFCDHEKFSIGPRSRTGGNTHTHKDTQLFCGYMAKGLDRLNESVKHVCHLPCTPLIPKHIYR